MRNKYLLWFVLVLSAVLMSSGCGSDDDNSSGGGGSDNSYLTSKDIVINDTLTVSGPNTHAIEVSGDGSVMSYSHLRINKTGDGSGEESDFYGTNAAVLASNGAALTLTDSLVITDGAYANGVFSYGSGTTVNVKDSVIITTSNNSGGIMTTGGGTMNAEHLTIETSGGSSAAIRSDRGGGTVSVDRGSYTSSGRGSPAIYSTADISVKNARLESKAAQGVVIEGKNSVTLENSELIARNNTHNSDNSTRYQAVMIYQSGSGDASNGKGEFTVKGGSITNKSGDIFFINNTAADITLNNTDITNEDESGIFLRAEAAGWGTSGSNGGKVNLYAENQTLAGDIVVDDISVLNMYLSGDSVFTGAINSADSEGQIYVELASSTWVLTSDSHITSLTCEEGSINLNDFKLYVDGSEYIAGTKLTGEAIEINSGNGGNDSDDNRPNPPSDNTSGDNRPNPPSDNTSGDNRPNPPDSGGDDSDDNDSGNNDTSMNFSEAEYTSATVNNVTYRAYKNLVYVSKPVNETYQRMNVYIPDAYFSGGTINGYTASTAPIFMPNGVGGYSCASAMTPSSSNSLGLALQNGLVVASPALRGRDANYGDAPACIVDYKAAVRYLRKAGLPAGNTDKIISSGTSAGGALSALLGATGNANDYASWLTELGAFDASDDIFAAMCYCPITNLDNADTAYEWMFGTGSTASETLSANFVTYINSLGLSNNGTGLTLGTDGTGSFSSYIAGVLKASAESGLSSGAVITENWLRLVDGEVVSVDLSVYGANRDKSQIPAFDRLDLSSAENKVFGNAHFTTYGWQNNTASSNSMADSAVIKAMNPMNYIGSASTAKYWRIRHGTKDTDTSLAIPAILALKLANNNCTVDFAAAWDEKHGGDYDLEELFSWINEICK